MMSPLVWWMMLAQAPKLDYLGRNTGTQKPQLEGDGDGKSDEVQTEVTPHRKLPA